MTSQNNQTTTLKDYSSVCPRCGGQLFLETDSTPIKDSAGPGTDAILVCIQCGFRSKI